MAADEQEKTEEPTAKKIADARKEGNVPKSQEVSALVSMLIGLVMLFVMFWYMTAGIIDLYHYYNSFFNSEFTVPLMVSIAYTSVIEIVKILAPMFLALIIAGVIGNVSQFGFLLTAKSMKFDLKKINPIKGLANVFGLKKLLDGLMTTLKVFAAFGIGSVIFFYFFMDVEELVMLPMNKQLIWFKEKALILIFALLFVFLIIAIIDLVIKRYQYFKQLKMSKQEVKDEHKQQEGNPEVKQKIRQLMYQNSGRRMMDEVPSADVVVTNPTHYAVALRYDQLRDRAPKVVAKGADRLALRIKEIARENLVHIVENPPLARELYKSVDVNEEVPEMMYQAVAELFAYVQKAQNKSDMSMR
ncbi:MAG: flagellar biosynthesis protein FlhB [Campylobacterales bacterium]